MSDKNPRQHLSKKSVKSLKEKRADKRAKTEPAPIAGKDAEKRR